MLQTKVAGISIPKSEEEEEERESNDRKLELGKVDNWHSFSKNKLVNRFPKVGSKAGSKALMGGLLSKLKAGALAESRGEENPGMVKISLPPVEAKKVSTEALGVTQGEAAPDWSAWEASWEC